VKETFVLDLWFKCFWIYVAITEGNIVYFTFKIYFVLFNGVYKIILFKIFN
jgi:hypothetical protein